MASEGLPISVPCRYPLYSPSASYRQLDTVAGSHQYTISGYVANHPHQPCRFRFCADSNHRALTTECDRG